jgi:hypothetical protein
MGGYERVAGRENGEQWQNTEGLAEQTRQFHSIVTQAIMIKIKRTND